MKKTLEITKREAMRAAPAKKSEIRPGTIRITASHPKVYEKTKASWKRSSMIFPEAMLVIKLFKKIKDSLIL
jgi:hypothetical protein